MKNPVFALLARCNTGFYPWQKAALAVLILVYIASPVDIMPDIIPLVGWGDDVGALYLLCRILGSPTLPKRDDTDDAVSAAAPAQRTQQRPQPRAAMVRREHVGGAR